jgi:uncharacterized membrane protein YqgA involved in biofilm formation
MPIPATGTAVNVAAVVAGSLLGGWLGHLVPERVRKTLLVGLGFSTLLIGMQLALSSRQILAVIGGLIIGGALGELAGIEAGLAAFGARLQRRFSGAGDVAEAFVTASLLYCVGAMAVMGSIQDGLGGEPTILYAKSALDGVASIALASTLGYGVILSVIPLALYQGGITLAATTLQPLLTDPVVREMNAVGGLLIVGIAIELLGIKKLPVGNLLPGVFVAAAIVLLFGLS